MKNQLSNDRKVYLNPILAKKPNHVILHNGANVISWYEAAEIVNNLLGLKL